jgi:hypothetical protein
MAEEDGMHDPTDLVGQCVSCPPPWIPDHELVRCIGEGAYGEVWLARNVLGCHRAAKIVHRARFQTDHPFDREFDGMRNYEPVSRSHEGLVQLLQLGEATPDASIT